MTVAAKSRSSSYATSFRQPSWSASKRANKKLRMLWSAMGWLSGYLVAPPQRHGGQAQYVERLVRSEENGNELESLREWMRENLALPLDLDLLAQRAHMSRRTLTRRFREETGVAPMAWLTDARLDRARQLLETTAEPVEKIGRLTGLGAPASVRAAFHRRVGTSPQEYRSLFRHLVTSG